ncbi:MAG: pyruvate kinase [Candidatus Magasanikbacteria bacterium]
MHKRTKIVCTLGPSSESIDTLKQMARAGMNVARLNFSHGTHENHKMIIDHIREVEEVLNMPITIMQDLQGPKIRVGSIDAKGIVLKNGKTILFSTALHAKKEIPIDYPKLHQYIKKGERMLFDDGRLEAVVLSVAGRIITAKVVVGGTLLPHKGINLPDSELTAISALTEKDKEDIRFGIQQHVDLIALSFVKTPHDVLDVRYFIEKIERELHITNEQPIRLIAKIEKREAVDRIDEIMGVVDGIMIARGDLGVEIRPAEVPLVQKRLVDSALSHGKPVIVATQMLDSMQRNPRPTRAEVSDVSNAVIDHTDAVMLSNETATGSFPVGAVQTMSEIIVETEKSRYDDLSFQEPSGKYHIVDETICGLARVVAEKVGAKLILGASISGETGRLISKYRPQVPIVVAVSTKRVLHQLNLSWGIHPFVLIPCNSIEELVERSILEVKKNKLAKKGDNIVVVAGEPVGQAGNINLLEVRTIS